MSFKWQYDKKKWDAFVKRLQSDLGSAKIDKVLKATAYKGLRAFVKAMPKSTGATKRSWQVRPLFGGYNIVSTSKVAVFLEEGTKAHGPKTAKFLYIPLRPGAAVWRKDFIFGEDYILVKRVKGIKGTHYLKPTTERIRKIMIQDFLRHLEKVGR